MPSTYKHTVFPVSLTNDPNTYSIVYEKDNNGNDYCDEEVRCRIVELHETLSIDISKDWAADSRNPKW